FGERHLRRCKDRGQRVSSHREEETRFCAAAVAPLRPERNPHLRGNNMTEQMTSTAAQPIQDKAPKPPGLMPKNIQAWVMLGLAEPMVIIMWLTGGKKAQTAPKSGAPAMQTQAPLEVNQAKITDLQNRIEELQREQQAAINQQNKFFGSLQGDSQTAAPAQVT